VDEAEKEYKQARIEGKAQECVYKVKIKAVEKEIAAAVAEEGSCSELRTKLSSLLKQQAENQPTERRYRTNDPTVEKLGELLRDNPNGMLLCRDEISGWLMNLEKPGREGDREFYLESWSGDSPFDVDRIARGTIKVEALCLSIVGGIQPGKLSRYVSGAVEGGWEADGLLQRLQLLVWPEISDGWELVDRRPNTKAYKAAVEVFQRLDGLKEVKTVRLLGGVPGLHFDSDAQEFFNDWLTRLEHRLRSGEIVCEALLSHLAKYRSLMPTLALLTHLADTPGSEPVTLDAAEKASALCDFFEGHALKIYAPAINPELQAAHTLSKKIKAGEVKDGSTVRELYRNQWSGLTTPASVRSGLQVLEKYGWLRCEYVGTVGRSTEILRLNPCLKNENA
jgi:putative DNA primase/helicase